MGKAEPIATNRTAEGRQLNRRAVVEFEIRDTEQ
jgi:outer membrane protein OmpA-like peptidoglycan-associated protein